MIPRKLNVAPGQPHDNILSETIAYVIGLGLALVLTGVSFWVASTGVLWGPGVAVGLVVLAIAQMGVHLVFFLHITSGPDNTNNVLALAFGVLIVFLVMIGTIWIMAPYGRQHDARTGAHEPADAALTRRVAAGRLAVKARAMAGPLSGLKIVEMAGLGPGPFAAMMLADHGAEVIRVERAGMIGVPNDPLLRSRRSISLDLKREECRDVVRRLASERRRADRRLSARRDGAARAWARGAAQRTIRRWSMAGSPAGGRTGRWRRKPVTTSITSRSPACFTASARRNGPSRADQLSRRLCRRRDDAGVRRWSRRCSRSSAAAKGQVIDAAMSDGAALIGALTYGLRAAGHVARRARGQFARWRRADLRRLSLPRRQVPRRWGDRAAIPRGACSRDWRWRRGASHDEIATVIAVAAARPMDRAFCRDRRLCRARARSR